MTCDGADTIAKNITMPIDLNVGDWLCMSGMGAYTYGPKYMNIKFLDLPLME